MFSPPSFIALHGTPERETMCLKIIFNFTFFLVLSLPGDFKKDFSELIYLK